MQLPVALALCLGLFLFPQDGEGRLKNFFKRDALKGRSNPQGSQRQIEDGPHHFSPKAWRRMQRNRINIKKLYPKNAMEQPKEATHISSRFSIGAYMQKTAPGGTFLELGVAGGNYSALVLGSWSTCERYIGVDPFVVPIDEQLSARLLKPFQQRGTKIEMKKGFSYQMIPSIPDGSIDFAFVDGCHNYDSVYNDLALLWSKIKVGGILAGHDFADPSDPRVAVHNWQRAWGKDIRYSGIPGAVNSFCDFVGHSFFLTWLDDLRVDPTHAGLPSFVIPKLSDTRGPTPVTDGIREVSC